MPVYEAGNNLSKALPTCRQQLEKQEGGFPHWKAGAWIHEWA
jgi:hypothetical protein